MLAKNPAIRASASGSGSSACAGDADFTQGMSAAGGHLYFACGMHF